MGLAWFPSASSSVNTLMGLGELGRNVGSTAPGAFGRVQVEE